MHKLIKISFAIGILSCASLILSILISFLYFRPTLPEINLVDESELQIPLKVFSKDGILIGEFGEIKRRPTEFIDIPQEIKNAFLAAEDDNFFKHQGISYTGLIRSFLRCIKPSGCQGGGGTITMQVVRGYLLTPEQTIVRKIKEIFLALQLEGILTKEEIFELYVNKIFLGNRSYGIEAAANTYFNKNLIDLSISESATIAAMAQLPSRVNPVKDPRGTLLRRNWILSRMYLLKFINKNDYLEALREEVKISKNIDLYEIDASHLAEVVRQEVVTRYGLRAYKEGWSVYTTIESESQQVAKDSLMKNLFLYNKRHGWVEPQNYFNLFTNSQVSLLSDLNIDFLDAEMQTYNEFNQDDILTRLTEVFLNYPYYSTHIKAIAIRVDEEKAYFLDENFDIKNISWTNEYNWARKKISVNEVGPRPQNFKDIIKVGDFVYLKRDNEFFSLDQIPSAEACLISIDPNTGSVKSYIGGKNYNGSKFDRVRLSYPQSGSSFKPFIYASGLANEYNLSSLINDAPVVFEDENLESIWRPKNYTGEYYGPISLRDALIKSINIVSIKLLRELGIENTHNYLEKFGFEKSRLPKDLSLALGSGNFSPVEMVRAFSVIANNGKTTDIHYIDSIKDRFGKNIFTHKEYEEQINIKNIIAFPWLDTTEMNVKKPYNLLKQQNINEKVIDERIAYLIKDTLRGFMKNGVAGRKSAYLKRDDIGGKTGTTNDSISTWFSGFHDDLVTTVWVGNDDFTSLGENEYGSTIAMPIWLDYMNFELKSLPVSKKKIPENIAFVRVNKSTGRIDEDSNDNIYFELFLEENIN